MVLAADVVYVGTGECALSHALLALRRRLPVRQREGSISFLFFSNSEQIRLRCQTTCVKEFCESQSKRGVRQIFSGRKKRASGRRRRGARRCQSPDRPRP